ncbi:MAG TPA: CBS domain-containing protein [Candidatus Bathyarchaeia archaeon]
MLIDEVGLGIFLGIVLGAGYSIPILLLSLVYRYIANERLPILMAVVLGVGLMGFAGGLSALADPRSLTTTQATQIAVGGFVIVWIVNLSDRLLTKVPHRGRLFGLIGKGRGEYKTIKLPDAQSMRDLIGRAKVPEQLKRDLAGMEFLLPSDLPIDELVARLKRRIITDWGVGNVELELDVHGKITYFALAGREQGVSASVKEGSVALPLRFERVPAGLGPGDLVTVYLKNGEVIDSTEVIGTDSVQKIVTIIVNQRSIEKFKDQEATLVIGLPIFKHLPLVKDVMTGPPQAVPLAETTKKVVELLSTQRRSSIVVLDGDKPVGIIRKHDLIEKAVAKELKLGSVQAKDIMTTPIVSISSEATLDEAIEVMRSKGLTELPVLDGTKPVGIFGMAELLKAGVTIPTRWSLKAKRQ